MTLDAPATPPSGPESPVTPAPAGQTNAQRWALLAHLSGLVVFLGLPFANLLAPLLIWIFKKRDSPVIEEHAREALNFQISMTIYFIVAGLAMFILIGFLLLPVLVIADLVLCIKAAKDASDGKSVRYPFSLRLIK